VRTIGTRCLRLWAHRRDHLTEPQWQGFDFLPGPARIKTCKQTTWQNCSDKFVSCCEHPLIAVRLVETVPPSFALTFQCALSFILETSLSDIQAISVSHAAILRSLLSDGLLGSSTALPVPDRSRDEWSLNMFVVAKPLLLWASVSMRP
jgi:hypothetical protein